MEETPIYPVIPHLLDRDTFNDSMHMLAPFDLSTMANYTPPITEMIGDASQSVHISSTTPRVHVDPPSFNTATDSRAISTEPVAAPHAARLSSGYVDDNYITTNHGVSMHNDHVAIDPHPQIAPPLAPFAPQIVAMPSLHMMTNDDDDNKHTSANDLSLCLPPLHINSQPLPQLYCTANSHYEILENDVNSNTNAADPFANSHTFYSQSLASHHPPPMSIKKEPPFPLNGAMDEDTPYHPVYSQFSDSYGANCMFSDYAEPYNVNEDTPGYRGYGGVSCNVPNALKKSSFYVAEFDDRDANDEQNENVWGADDDDIPLEIEQQQNIDLDASAFVHRTQEENESQSTVREMSEEKEDSNDLSVDEGTKQKKERKKRKTAKRSRKKTKSRKKKAAKTRRKRTRKEMMEDDMHNNDNYDYDEKESANKKRKIDRKDVEKYVAETMTRREANKVFNEMMSAGDVVMDEQGNWCYSNGCNKSFKSKCHLKRHVEEAHIGRAFRCTFPDCAYDEKGGVFKQRTQTKEHVANIHFAAASGWRCFLCDAEFTRWWGVRRHLELKRCKKMKKSMTLQEIREVLDEMQQGETRNKCKV